MFQLDRSEVVERVTFASTVALALTAALGPTREAFPIVVPVALAIASVVLLRRISWVPAAFLAIAPLTLAMPRYPEFAHGVEGALLGLATLALARQLNPDRSEMSHFRLRVALSAVLTSIVFVAGSVVLEHLRGGTVLSEKVPVPVVFAIGGAALGTLLGLVSIVAFLKRAGDEVHVALAKLSAVRSETLRGLVQELVEARSKVLRAVESLPAEDAIRREARRAADAVALAGIRLVDRFAVADRVLSGTPIETLENRLSGLDRQLAEATDVGVQRDLTRAREMTAEQLAQVRTLEQARDRLAARLHAEVAALRRNETSLALLASTDAAVAALELEVIGSGLSRRAADLAAEGAELHAAMASAPVRSVVSARA